MPACHARRPLGDDDGIYSLKDAPEDRVVPRKTPKRSARGRRPGEPLPEAKSSHSSPGKKRPDKGTFKRPISSGSKKRPSSSSKKRPNRPVMEEVVRVGDLDAIGTAKSQPPVAPATAADRIGELLDRLKTVGPGDQGPVVASLLANDVDLALRMASGEFPGLLWFHRHLRHHKLPLGRDIGPYGAFFVAAGTRACPYLIAILDEGNADERYYAALVVSDLATEVDEELGEELIDALGRRLYDGDTQVRGAALHALLVFAERGWTGGLVKSLLSRVADPSVNVGIRMISLKALGVFRDPTTVPGLIELFDARRREIRDAARDVLRTICGEDKGTSKRKWSSWVKKNGDRSRLHWLLDGLVHRDALVREIAYHELVKATGHEIEFDPKAGRADRKKARQAYAEFLGL